MRSKGSQSSDPFWEKSETALLQALMLYLLHEAPPEEQNFAMIMEMLGSAQVKEEDEDYESPLDILFDRLEMRDPDSIAVKQYHIYKQAAGVVSLKRLLNQSNLKSWTLRRRRKEVAPSFQRLRSCGDGARDTVSGERIPVLPWERAPCAGAAGKTR